MTAAALLERIEAAGCSLVLEGDRARLRGPAGALTPELIAEARQRKAELVAALRGGAGARRLGAFTLPASCPRCRAALPPVALVGDPGGPFTVCPGCRRFVRGGAA